MPYLIYSPSAVNARITSPTIRAKLTDTHIAVAAVEFAQERGFAAALSFDPVSWADALQRETSCAVADDEIHQLLAGRTALLIYETEIGVPS